MQLADSVVLVTGGSSGIGKGIAHTLVSAGARVAITGRDRTRLDDAARAVGAHAIQADVSKEADASRVVRQTLATFGRLDVLVNNAGFGVFAPLVELKLADFERVFATN